MYHKSPALLNIIIKNRELKDGHNWSRIGLIVSFTSVSVN